MPLHCCVKNNCRIFAYQNQESNSQNHSYMRYLCNTSTDPYFNMAFDEYALECLTLDEPLFYLWQNRPAVIVGLNQNVYAEVDLDYLHEQGIALVRRVTGGGAVYHDLGNLNYTIVGRTHDLERDYPEYTRYMLQALRALGVDAELSGRNDILVSGRKVSGYAKRVYKDRLMVHGTLMYDVNIEHLTAALTPSADKLGTKGIASVRSRVANLREFLPTVEGVDDLRAKLEYILSRGHIDTPYILTPQQLDAIDRLARDKFASPEWIYHRSAPTSCTHRVITRKARLACGRVEVQLHIDLSGIITCCRFCGDFIGSLPATPVECLLQGVLYEREALRSCLQSIVMSDYFDGVDSDDLLNVLFGA